MTHYFRHLLLLFATAVSTATAAHSAAVTAQTAATAAQTAATTAQTAATTTLQSAATTATAADTDTIIIYSPHETRGLHLAVKQGNKWQYVGQLCVSDYGTWGVEKRMYHPSVCRADDGTWRLVFQVNDHAPLLAMSYSKDLITWRPQDYVRMSTRQCLDPVIRPVDDGFEVLYRSEQGLRIVKGSADFRRFSADRPIELMGSPLWRRDAAMVGDQRVEGQKFVISSDECAAIRHHFEQQQRLSARHTERMHDDQINETMNRLTMAYATLNIGEQPAKAISDKLIGVFFEDISYAADGGLYAEMVQNRDFEYTERDHKGWSATTAWHCTRPIEIATEHPLHANNAHYALLWPNDTLWNDGWDGMVVEAGKQYDFSMHVLAGGQKQTFAIQLVGHDGTVLAKTTVDTKGGDWKQYTSVLKATAGDTKARLAVIPTKAAHVGVDMISLFPQDTYNHRKNGLRRDLAEAIAALHPKFVRFPGGCMSHGQGIDNIYHWHHTIGELWERKPDFNIWHYHQTRGLGFYEYFQFCEDIGAEPLPVLAAGVPCQNSAANADGVGGQQGGIPMEDMDAYVEELCNLIEWANGDPKTNAWAAKRAAAGHPEPFHLKYLGIGNEDIISTVFEDRFEMIARTIRQRYPDIMICGTVGPFHAPSADYSEGWDFTRRNPGMQYMVDEHYYESTGWFMNNRNYYDQYPRLQTLPDGSTVPATKVYLGEWAASTNAKRPNLETALAEALYLTDIERNGDIVCMTSYAPMLCKDGHSNWNPDMIYFSNTGVRTTPAYDVQRLFSVYSGDTYHPSRLEINSRLSNRVGASLVSDSKTGRRFLKLVNALPVPLQLSVIGIDVPQSVVCEELTGESITDQRATTHTVSTDQPLTLPPYTLRVIEL